MGYIIIQRKDRDEERLSDMMSEMLHIGGRIMTLVEDMRESESMNERRHFGMRGRVVMRDGMGMRDGGMYGNRWDEPYYPTDMMLERRVRR